MIALADVRSFCEIAGAATTSADLFDAVRDITTQMGFKHFALVHHIDVREIAGSTIRLVDYPSEWVEIFEERRLYASDPIHRASHKTSAGFRWAHLDRMISLTPRDHAVLGAAQEVGIGDGFTVPAHIPGELNGSCSFAMKVGEELDLEQLPFV